jgi:anti-sigma B factor antagonist
MQLATRRVGEWLVASPAERRIDVKLAGELKRRMTALIEEGNQCIILELSRVEYIDSAGLGAIVSILKALDGRGSLILAGCGEQVSALLELTGLDTILETTSTVEAFTGSRE